MRRASFVAALLLFAAHARAETVSYVANIHTTAGNPVTDLLILEEDLGGVVHSSIFGSNLPGFGTSVISHDPGFSPAKSLILGLTEGFDVTGAPKTQIIAFLDNAFAAANDGKLWSQIFVGTRHSETITSLRAAVSGDATQRAWFTDTFYPGPAAGAAFVTGGSFTVAEFTGLNTAGSSAVNGNWVINQLSQTSIPGTVLPNSQDAFAIDETAQVDLGPFDIELALFSAREFGVDKTVLNNTGADWNTFVMELGRTVGGVFIPSTPGDGLAFTDTLNFPVSEESGAFPTVEFGEDRLVFRGFLAAGDTARFIAFIDSDTIGSHAITLRQFATPEPASLLVFAAGGMVLVLLRSKYCGRRP